MRIIEKSPLNEKSIEELVQEANKLIEKSAEHLSEEEEIEDDAEGGYFQQDGED